MKITAKIPPLYTAPPEKDKGVFVGTRTLLDKDGTILGTFNVFADREDLSPHEATYYTTAAFVATMKDRRGYRCGGYATQEDLYKAIRANKYDGEWFIPTKDILKENLYKNKDKEGLKDSFNGVNKAVFPWYWSCTERKGAAREQYAVHFGKASDVHNFEIYSAELLTRLVRLEPYMPL